MSILKTFLTFIPLFVTLFVTDAHASYKPTNQPQIVDDNPFIFRQSWKNIKTQILYTDVEFRCEGKNPVSYELSQKDFPCLDLSNPESCQTFHERLRLYIQGLTVFNVAYSYKGTIDTKSIKIKHIPVSESRELEFEKILPFLNFETFVLELSEFWVKIKGIDIRFDIGKKLKELFGRKPFEKRQSLSVEGFDKLVCTQPDLKGRVKNTVGDISIHKLPYLPGIDGFMEEGREKKNINYTPAKTFYLEEIGAIASRIYTQEEIQEEIGETYEIYEENIEENDSEDEIQSNVSQMDFSISESNDLYLPSLLKQFRRIGGEKRIEMPIVFCDGKGRFFLTQSFEQDCIPLTRFGEVEEEGARYKVRHTRLTPYPIELKIDIPLQNIPQGLYYLNEYGVWMHLNDFYEAGVFKFTSGKYEAHGSLMDDVMNQKPRGYYERLRAWEYILTTAGIVAQSLGGSLPSQSEDAKFFKELYDLFFTKAYYFLQTFGGALYSPNPPCFKETVWDTKDPRNVVPNYPLFDGNENHVDRVEAVFEKLTQLIGEMPEEQRKLLSYLSQDISLEDLRKYLLEKRHNESFNFECNNGLINNFKLFQTLGDFTNPLKIYKNLITNDIKKSLDGLGGVKDYVTLTCQERYAELKNRLLTNPGGCGFVKMILDLKPEEAHLRLPLLLTAKYLKNLKDPELYTPHHKWRGNGDYPMWTHYHAFPPCLDGTLAENLEYSYFMNQQKSKALKFLPLFRGKWTVPHSSDSGLNINLTGIFNYSKNEYSHSPLTQEVWNDVAVFVNMDGESSFDFGSLSSESDSDLTICNFARSFRNLKHLRKCSFPEYIGFKNFQFLINQLAENRSITHLFYSGYGESPIAAIGELLAKNNTIEDIEIRGSYVHDLEFLNVLGDGLALNTGLKKLSVGIEDNLHWIGGVNENIEWLSSNPSTEYMKRFPRRPLPNRTKESQTFDFSRLKEGILKSNLEALQIKIYMNNTSSPSYPARQALESMLWGFKDCQKKFYIMFNNNTHHRAQYIVNNL